MSSTESVSGEKQKIFEWAKKYHSDDTSFETKLESQYSYFEPFDSKDDAVEYGFSKLEEFRKDLLQMWSDVPGRDEIALICAVAAFKDKPSFEKSPASNGDTEDFTIPDFVYAF